MSLRKANITLSAILILFSGWVIYESQGFRDPRTGQIPSVLAGIIILMSVAILVMNLLPPKGSHIDEERPYGDVQWGKWAATAGLLALYGFGLRQIGFYESAFLFLTAVSFLMTGDKSNIGRTIIKSFIFGLVGTVVLYLLFDIILSIPTARGLFI